MTRRNHPADWMWAQALDVLSEAGRMHQAFFRLSTSARAPAWEPPVDVFEDGAALVVVVALPGVSAERVHVLRDAGGLVVRAERPLPFADARFAVRQLEIPYGDFERRIPLPPGRYEPAGHELTHGCLVLRLRKVD